MSSNINLNAGISGQNVT